MNPYDPDYDPELTEDQILRFYLMDKGLPYKHIGKKEDKSKTGKLVWRFRKEIQTIHSNKPFAFLQSEKSRLRFDPKYVGGILEIEYSDK